MGPSPVASRALDRPSAAAPAKMHQEGGGHVSALHGGGRGAPVQQQLSLGKHKPPGAAGRGRRQSSMISHGAGQHTGAGFSRQHIRFE
jgi:hypothetical protein